MFLTTLLAWLAVGMAGVALWRTRGLQKRLDALERAQSVAPTPASIIQDPPTEAPEQPKDPAAISRKPWPTAPTKDTTKDPGAPRQPSALAAWLRENWIYPVAGVALMFAGIFLVQYSIEAGVLSPRMRVILAGLLGLAFVVLGEWLRRRPGDDPRVQFLPATFAAAGIVVLHASVLAALHLYALVPPGLAFAAMVGITLGALALGWVHGPLLAVLGILAGAAVPFLLGGGDAAPGWLFGYFLALVAMGLGIDGLRGWRRIWPVALAAPGVGAVLVSLSGAAGLGVYLLLATGLAMALPGGALVPRADGAPLSLALRNRGRAQAATKAAGAMAAFSAIAMIFMEETLLAPTILVAVIALFALATRHAPPMRELAILPALALPGWTIWEGLSFGANRAAFDVVLDPGQSTPLHATQILALSLMAALALARLAATAPQGSRAAGGWMMLAVALPGAVAVALELFWNVGAVLGDYPWALQVMVLAGVATMGALWAARWPMGQGRDLGLGASASAAFALIALAMVLSLGETALTVALAVLMVASALMERRFSLSLLGVFQALALVVLSWRLVIDPGAGWFLDQAGALEVLLVLIATLGAPAATLALGARATATRAFLETGLSGLAAISAAFVLARFLSDDLDIFTIFGLQATVLISLSWVQFARAKRMQGFARLRNALGWIFAALAAGCVGLAVFVFSPLSGGFLGGTVSGAPVLNELLLAYAAPGLALWAFARRVAGRRGIWARGAGLALLAVWAGMAIRHLWQGRTMELTRGIAEGELYAYTVAMLALGFALVARALITGRADLRRTGMAVVALAAAKAFLVDAAGLDGLLRVFAFLGLGLALAALAWLDRWARGRERPQA